MQRYLMRVSYSGHKFIGSQKQLIRLPPHEWTERYMKADLLTVQGALEQILTFTLKPKHGVVAWFASRTDVGVHSMDSPVIVFLQKRHHDDSYYDPKALTYLVNEALIQKGVDLRILNTLAVDDEFSLKSDILDRTYLYRFAVRKDNLLSNQENHSDNYFQSTKDESYFHSKLRVHCTARDYYLPVQDQPLITEIKGPFCPKKAEKSLKLFEGKHNHYNLASNSARVYKHRDQEGKYVKTPYRMEFFQRTISETTFEQVQPPISEKLVPAYKLFDFYQFTVRAPAFYQNQIRRMATLVFSMARGEIGPSHISKFFDEGQSNAPLPALAPPCGLYLIKTRYKDDILKNHTTDDVSKLPLEKNKKHDDVCEEHENQGWGDHIKTIKPIEWDKMEINMKHMKKLNANQDFINTKRDNIDLYINTPTDEPDIEINKNSCEK